MSQERKYRRASNKIKYEYSDNTIKVGTKTFCLYKEVPIDYLNEGSRRKEFTDMAFYTTDSLPVIYLEARALSLYGFQRLDGEKQNRLETFGVRGGAGVKIKDYHLRLINYYRVEFSPLQRELNIEFQRETLHLFIKDLILFKVFDSGKFNVAGAKDLIWKWKGKELYYLSKKMLSHGLQMGYLKADLWRKKEYFLRDAYRVDFAQRKIYLNDSLIATYTLNELPEGYTEGLATSFINHYYIVDKSGKMLSDICSNPSTSFATMAYYANSKPSYITFPMVDKCEQKQVVVSLDVLIQMGKL